MKKHLYLFTTLLIAATLFTACSKDDDSVAPQPTPSTGSLASPNLDMPAPKGGSSIIVTHTAKLNKNLAVVGVNYSVEWDTEKHSQRWSCYKMYSTVNSKLVTRYYSDDKSLNPSGQYPNDTDLPAAYRFTSDPYWGTGYDHGHICPSNDRVSSDPINYQTFFMTNMQPQYGSSRGNFNGGVWANLENQVNQWKVKFDTLYVCKGGTIDNEANIIEYLGSGQNKIPVPKYFFMAVLGRNGDKFQATGFWINQQEYVKSSASDKNSRKKYAVTIKEIQDYTGIDFFHNLPDDIENAVENVSKTQMYQEWTWVN